MKNICVLKTDKPSKLFKDDLGYYFSFENLPRSNFINHLIYITSDEEIKEGRCWVINSMNKIESVPHSKWGKLIILTTDQDLIKDGVQSIDDEFLEWFCSKNGEVDFVEVIQIRDEKN